MKVNRLEISIERIVIVFLMVLSILTILACNKAESEKVTEEKTNREEKEKKETVKISKDAIEDINLTFAEIKEEELKGEIVAPAKLIPNPDMEALVGSIIQGRVSKVFVKIGDYLKKGQSLMLIEGLQIGEIKSQFLKAKAGLKYAEANYNRQKKLIDEKIGSQKSFLEAKAEFEKSKAEFNAEDKRIHSIGLSDIDVESDNDKDDHTSGILAVKSPIEGIVVERNVVIGQYVEPSSNSFRIINTQSLLCDGQIYEYDLARISGKPEITIKTSSYPEQRFHGKIIYTGEIVDKESRTIKIRAIISNHDRKLKPEMFAEMYIPIEGTAKAMVVPVEAVIRDGKENYLFVVVNDTTFEKRNVELGSSVGEKVEVRNGVKKGEKIVCKGSLLLKSELKKSSFSEGGD
jgi:membrane fusion protein, heavy metal efflux system